MFGNKTKKENKKYKKRILKGVKKELDTWEDIPAPKLEKEDPQTLDKGPLFLSNVEVAKQLAETRAEVLQIKESINGIYKMVENYINFMEDVHDSGKGNKSKSEPKNKKA